MTVTTEPVPTATAPASPFAGLDASALKDVAKLAPPKVYDPFVVAAAQAAFDAGTPKRFEHPDPKVVKRFAAELRQYVGEKLRNAEGAIPVLRWRPQPVEGGMHAGHFTVTVQKTQAPASEDTSDPKSA